MNIEQHRLAPGRNEQQTQYLGDKVATWDMELKPAAGPRR